MVLARVLCVLSLVAATTALAQDPPKSPSPTPAPTTAPSPAPQASPSPLATSPDLSASPSPSPTPAIVLEEIPLGPDELRIRANRQEGGEGRLHYEGFVDLRFGQMRIQADSLDMTEETKADGATAQTIEARGNVVFMSGQERISGETLRLDLDTGKGMFTKASGYLQPDVLFEAESIERVDADTYRLKGATFTACTQPNPRWQFRAQSATVDIDKRIKATMVGLRIKGVPTPLILPYFQFPISPNKRTTGILLPRYGSSSVKGREFGLGFFWAMGRSMDQTLYYDYFTKYGIGLGHEFRFIRDAASRGTFRSYFTRPQGATEFAYDLDWAASQALPARFKATLSANLYSDLTLRQELQEDFDYASTRTRRGAAGIQGAVGPAYVRLEAATNDIFFPGGGIQRKRHLPQLQISQSPKKIGRTGIAFGFETTAERLALGNDQVLQNFSRIDLAPELTRSLSVPFLQISPRVLVRQTRYGASVDETGALEGPPIDRRFFEASVDVRGPKLFKIFSLPGDFYSDKFKHTIEPEFFYTYRSSVDTLNSIPNFDFSDYYPGTNQVLYGLTQRLYAKRPGPTGAPVTHEVLTVRVNQTYYLNLDEDQGRIDFNYFTGNTATQSTHYSPVVTRIQFRPTIDSSLNFSTEYNATFKQFPTTNLSISVRQPRATIQAGWSRFALLSKVVEERKAQFDTLRASGRLVLWPERVTVSGSVTYDRIESRLLQYTTKVRYGIQCCAFAVERVAYNTRFRSEKKTTFQIELAGLGSVGGFMGDNAAGQNNAGRK